MLLVGQSVKCKLNNVAVQTEMENLGAISVWFKDLDSSGRAKQEPGMIALES